MRTIPDIGQYKVFENPIFIKSEVTKPSKYRNLQFEGFYINGLDSHLFKFNSWRVEFLSRDDQTICKLHFNFSFKESIESLVIKVDEIDFASFLQDFYIKNWIELTNYRLIENYSSIFGGKLKSNYYLDLAKSKLNLPDLSEWGIRSLYDPYLLLAEIKNLGSSNSSTLTNEAILNSLGKINYGLNVNFALLTANQSYTDLVNNSMLALALDQIAHSANLITQEVIHTMDSYLLAGV